MLEKLACKLGRNDEKPNIELAEYLCLHNDMNGIKEIVAGLHYKNKAVANDCIKVLYEIGERKPELITVYVNDFISCLHSKSNRIVWGSMTALSKIAEIVPQPIFTNIDAVMSVYEADSVITVDNSVSVFAGLCRAGDSYAKTILPVLLNHLRKCRPKDVPQHAERTAICFNAQNANDFIEVLKERSSLLTPSRQVRIKRLLKTLYDLLAVPAHTGGH